MRCTTLAVPRISDQNAGPLQCAAKPARANPLLGMSSPPPFTLAGILKGAKLAIPFGFSSLVYGIAFGLLAAQLGFSVLEAVAMSALVFSGTAQVAVLQAWSAAPALLPLFLTVLIVNSRYVLMGAALRPWLGGLSPTRSNLTLLTLVDGSFALAMRERDRGDPDVGILLGSGLVSYTGWVVATGLGFVVGQAFGNPRAIGLDFIVVGFCTASAVMMWHGQRDLWPVGAAAGAVLAGELIAPGAWIVVAAGLVAAVVGALRYRPAPVEAAQ